MIKQNLKKTTAHVDTRKPHGKKTRAEGVQAGCLGCGNEWDGQSLDEGGGKRLLGLLHSPRLRFIVGGLKVLILLKITN